MSGIVKLPYGKEYISLELSDNLKSHILTGKHAPGADDEAELIRQALRSPVESPALKDRIGRDDKVVIITTDNTRHCPDDRILPVILGELEQVIPRRNITIVVALGLHPPMTREELVGKLGKDIIENYTVKNHDPNHTVRLGITTRGTPVEVNEDVVGADFRISTGFIEPHFFAGYSGGRKSIAPGVSSAASIRHNHSISMIEHPRSRAGVLDGNPIHEDMVEQARMAKLDFIVNVLLNPEKRITHVFAGDPFAAHASACAAEEEFAKVELDREVDITIISNSGAPLDLDFYQTVKGIDTAFTITRKGGIIIMASACDRGIGAEDFHSIHASCRAPVNVLDKLHDPGHCGGWQNLILARAQRDHEIYLLSNMPDEDARCMMVTPVHSLQEGLDMALKKLGDNVEIAVIPEGPLVLPVVRKY